MSFCNGFTLAEVLITLGVIGVVAAMTLPTITQKIDKQTTVAKLKKSMSTMHEIIRLAEKDHGEVWEWDYSDIDYDHAFNESPFFKRYFEPYIKKVGNYGGVGASYHKFSSLDGINIDVVESWVVLPDGTAIGAFNNSGVDGSLPGGGAYMWIFIDINGSNKPNILGKDIFMTELVRQKRIQMWGSTYKDRDYMINGSHYSCKKGTNQRYAGGYCGALIQADGWEIKDDYPW